MDPIGFAELEPFLDRKRSELFMALSEFSGQELISSRELPDGWTPAQIVWHLAQTERTVVRQIELLLRSESPTPPELLEEKIVDIYELFKARGLLGTRKKTPPSLEPPDTVSYVLASQQLTEVRDSLKLLLPELAGRATNGLVAPHLLGLSLNACQWVMFSAFHEWSHILQLKRIRASHPKAAR
jgi:hypothetical protein